jgi:hypothetical protein
VSKVQYSNSLLLHASNRWYIAVRRSTPLSNGGIHMSVNDSSPCSKILDWLAQQDQETQQHVVMQLIVMGGCDWWGLEFDHATSPSESIGHLRTQLTEDAFRDVGLALCLRTLVTFAVAKQGESEWTSAERVHRLVLTSKDSVGQAAAQKFFEQEALRKKRWERVAAGWRALETEALTDEHLDRWLLSHPPHMNQV